MYMYSLNKKLTKVIYLLLGKISVFTENIVSLP